VDSYFNDVIFSEDLWKTSLELFGGRKISEKEVPSGQRVADFVHDEWKLFFELKILETSIIENEALLEKITDLTTPQIDDFLKKKIERIVKSANEQLKSTMKLFKKFNYQGILVIGNYAEDNINTGIIYNIIYRILNNDQRYRSINAILYITRNQQQVTRELSISHNFALFRKNASKSTIYHASNLMNGISDSLNALNGVTSSIAEKNEIDRLARESLRLTS
jgi:hypothetical protein